MTTELMPCGTVAAAQRHYKRGEPLCAECHTAWRAYQTEWRRNHPRPKTARPPRIPLADQLADEQRRADQLAIALAGLVCDRCDHHACDTGRRAMLIWATARGLHDD